MYELLKMKKGEQNLCPFPHKKEKNGKVSLEKVPSCGIDNKGQFNCFVCERSYTSEDWFTTAYLNCSLQQAEKFNKMLRESRIFLPNRKKWEKHTKELVEEMKDETSIVTKYVKELKLENMIEDGRLGLYQGKVTLPTFYKGQIINLCRFCPGEVPKYRNSPGALTGIITTTRLFKSSKEDILICAGEKDMLVATKNGFNAITILGGEKAKPHFYKKIFRNKKVYIAYDNDKAGMEGAIDLAAWLYRYTREIKVLNLSDVFDEKIGDLKTTIKENKEDLTDFFLKYERTDLDLLNLIDNCNWWQPPAVENQSVLETLNTIESAMKELRKKLNEKK